MHLDKWHDIKSLVETKFGFERYDKEDFELGEDDKGQIVKGEREIIEFNGPLGRMMLEFDIKPVVLDKKVFGSKRIGGDNKVAYIYSADEKCYKLRIYKFNEEKSDWEQMDSDNFLG